MDLNSYLTDFFSLLNNSSNMRGGNNNMFGGDAIDDLRAKLAAKGVNTNKEILDYYFQNVPENVSVGHEPFLIKDGQAGGYNLRGGATKKEEFVDNQVLLTQIMLQNADSSKDNKDVHYAASMASNTLAAVAADDKLKHFRAYFAPGNKKVDVPLNFFENFIVDRIFIRDNIAPIIPLNKLRIGDLMGELVEKYNSISKTDGLAIAIGDVMGELVEKYNSF